MGHGVSLDDPVGQYAPAAQLLHALTLVRPVEPWYWPAAQLVHDVALVQPAPLCRPAGQSAQVLHLNALL